MGRREGERDLVRGHLTQRPLTAFFFGRQSAGMSPKAVMMMIIMRTDRDYDDWGANTAQHHAVEKVLGGVRTDERDWDANPVAGCDGWSVCWVSLRPPHVDGVHIPATDPECNRQQYHRRYSAQVGPDGQAAYLDPFYSTLAANWSVQYGCMQNIPRNQSTK